MLRQYLNTNDSVCPVLCSSIMSYKIVGAVVRIWVFFSESSWKVHSLYQIEKHYIKSSEIIKWLCRYLLRLIYMVVDEGSLKWYKYVFCPSYISKFK